MSRRLMSGNTAIAKAAMVAGCKFFAGYPMSPFTELLENFSNNIPEYGGVCINVESEIEGANMALGAAASGARAATGSTGQGLALMQETIAESALNETPMVFFNMARNQQDYFQATRGGGWGDYRTITLAPKDVEEAVEHTQLLFHLADLYRAPTLLYGDDLIAHTEVAVDVQLMKFEGSLPAKDWALDGSLSGTGRSRVQWTFAYGKHNTPGPRADKHWKNVAAKFERIRKIEMRWEERYTDDADIVVVAFGSAAKYVEHVVERMRAKGVSIGYFRPITLWPYPHDALEAATNNSRHVLVYELNAGQMVDDVKLSVADKNKVKSIGGISIHESSLAYGELMSAKAVFERIEGALKEFNP